MQLSKEYQEAMLELVRSGHMVAVPDNGEVTYIADVHATDEQRKIALTAKEVALMDMNGIYSVTVEGLGELPGQLRKLRQITGMSQSELAARVWLSGPAVVSLWENGHRVPSLERMFAIAAACGGTAEISISISLKGDGDGN